MILDSIEKRLKNTAESLRKEGKKQQQNGFNRIVNAWKQPFRPFFA
jgi:hypothetical protein